MKLKDLIKRLEKDKAEYHGEEVEFIVCRRGDGAIITMNIERNAGDLVKALKLFRGVGR